jgi:hypothetical protein
METPRLDLIRLPSILARGALVAGLAGVLLGAACGGSDGTGTAGSSGAGTTGGSAAGTSGGAGTGAAGTGMAGSGVAGTGVAGSNAGSGGSTTGVAGTGGSNSGTAGSGGSTAGTAGAGGAAAGTTGTGGGSAGRGGSAGGQAGQTGSAGRGGAAGTGTAGSGQGGSAGGGGPATCPTNATFCSGFETAAMPTGAIYKVNAAPGEWTRDFAVDTAQKNSGSSSLRVKSAADAGTSGSAYKMLAVPATMNAFWVRFFVRSDVPMGGEHNAFAVASINDEPNDGMGVEFAEDVGIAFNASDDVRWPTGYGRLTTGGTNPYVLPANMWHCVEISFDGAARVQQLFVNGMSLINAATYPSATRAFKNFKFGFNSLHGPNRNMWYDDVAVAPTRVGGCP